MMLPGTELQVLVATKRKRCSRPTSTRTQAGFFA
jgi:hypothetical protein